MRIQEQVHVPRAGKGQVVAHFVGVEYEAGRWILAVVDFVQITDYSSGSHLADGNAVHAIAGFFCLAHHQVN